MLKTVFIIRLFAAGMRTYAASVLKAEDYEPIRDTMGEYGFVDLEWNDNSARRYELAVAGRERFFSGIEAEPLREWLGHGSGAAGVYLAEFHRDGKITLIKGYRQGELYEHTPITAITNGRILA